MRHLDRTLKQTKDLEAKDMRHYEINFNFGDFNEEDVGILLKTRFGIIDGKSEPAYSLRDKLKFSEKDCWISFKIYLDTD
jgi:hypothetical protein